GKKQEAISTFNDAIKVNPYYWANFSALGSACFRFGENEREVEAYHKVRTLAPDSARGWSGEGAAFYRMGKLNEAIPLFQKAIELEATPGHYDQLGVVYFFLGRYSES